MKAGSGKNHKGDHHGMTISKVPLFSDVYNKYMGDVDSIKFQPSPNFKYMRKYFKAQSSQNQSLDGLTSSLNKEEQQSVTMQASTSRKAPPGQHPLPPNSRSPWSLLPPNLPTPWPPLPPNSPPPPWPPLPPKSPNPDMRFSKQKMEEKEYNNRAIKVKNAQQSKKEMCRQFIRGTCIRGPSCIFAHKLILSQLHNVYTFCKDFQNSVCNLKRCKYVHATVFEKEHYYRTGCLPPRALAHLKKSNRALSNPFVSAEAPPAKSTHIFMNPSANRPQGVSALPMSGTSSSDVLPSPMYGPTPRTFPLKIRPPAKPTDFVFMNPSQTMPPRMSTLQMSGTSPPDVLPVSEMHGSTPRSVPLDRPIHKCSNCDINKCRLRSTKQNLRRQRNDGQSLRQQKAKDETTEARLNKLIALLLENKRRSAGTSDEEQQRDADLVACGFLMSELENKKLD